MCSPTWQIVWHVSSFEQRTEIETKGGDLVGKFVSVLAWRRNPHCARPVVVHVSQLVADLGWEKMHWAYQFSSPSGWCRAWGQCCRGLRCSEWATLCPGRRAATPRRSRTNPSSLPASRRVLMQYLLSSPDFGTWSRSRSGPMSKKSPEKGPICLSSPEVHKCDFELCTDATVCILFLRGRHHQLQYSICTVNLWKKYVKT